MRRRGELAGYAGTLLLEEVDEDEHVARYRFQGIRAGATATATITVAADLTAEVHPGHGSALTAEQLVAAAADVLGRGEVPVGGLLSTQPAVAAGAGSPPAPRGPAVAADGEAPPAQAAPAAARRRALVVAGATAALVAWALRGRR